MALIIYLKLEKEVIHIPEVQIQVKSNCSIGDAHNHYNIQVLRHFQWSKWRTLGWLLLLLVTHIFLRKC